MYKKLLNWVLSESAEKDSIEIEAVKGKKRVYKVKWSVSSWTKLYQHWTMWELEDLRQLKVKNWKEIRCQLDLNKTGGGGGA